MMIGITAAVLTAGLGMTTVLAQNSQTQARQATVSYVDENGDGICDNTGNGQCAGQNFVDENGDGICDNAGQRQCLRQGFTDANNDGICDNAGSGSSCGQARRAG